MNKGSPLRCFQTKPEVILLAVMLYVLFLLSLRNVEDLLHERVIEICDEAVRIWWMRFGPMSAAEIRGWRTSGMGLSRWCWSSAASGSGPAAPMPNPFPD